jgi:hypothetical protein
MNAIKQTEYHAVNLGHLAMAQLAQMTPEAAKAGYGSEYSYSLTIMTPATGGADEHYNPPESVQIRGREALANLRDFLNEKFRDVAGIDYSIPRLSRLCGAGFQITVERAVSVADDLDKLEELTKEAITLFSGAGWNITTENKGAFNPIILHCTPMA